MFNFFRFQNKPELLNTGSLIESEYRRLLSAKKVHVFFHALSATLIGLLIYSFTILLPLKRIEPIFVEYSADTNLQVKVTRVGESVTGNEYLIKSALKNYLILWETLKPSAETNRKIRLQSSDEIFQIYEKIAQKRKENISYRTAKIMSIAKNDSNLYSFLIETNTRYINSQDLQKEQFTILVSFSISQIDSLKESDALLNPIGLKITHFQVSKHE